MTHQSNPYRIPSGGFAEVAEYKQQALAEYRENPLIEALPAILSEAEFITLASEYPAFDKTEKGLDASLRLHCVERILKYFQPLAGHIALEQQLSRIIRQGYLARNPIRPEYAARLRQINRAMKQTGDDKLDSLSKYVSTSSSASGFTMIGVSGVGKSTAIERILRLYPQVILHSDYQGPLNLYQIVWLKLDCPHAGSLKGLCTEFFNSVDHLLGTNYARENPPRYSSEDSMLIQMGEVASTHCLGVLVIDEIQDLSTAKSGGAEKVLNFFVRMVTKLSVPVIRIGTNKAMPILQGDFRHARRGIGEGAMYWDRLKRDTEKNKKVWQFFVKGFFDYQWTRENADYTDEMDEVLYEESQGVVDIAIKLFMIAQWRAIANGKERISPELVRRVAKDSLHLVRPMLDALKSDNTELISKYSDIRPIDLRDFYEKYRSKVAEREQRKLKQLSSASSSSVSAPDLLSQVILGLLDLGLSPSLAKHHAEEVFATRKSESTVSDLVNEAYRNALDKGITENSPKSPKGRGSQSGKKKAAAYLPGDLRQLVSKGKDTGMSSYEALKAGGIIKSPIDDFYYETETC
ncbi:MAG TPA: ATP-binding protein [Blastocatellia bacterium]|nr:ATP-binding protein [Blastocatellia bacterium]